MPIAHIPADISETSTMVPTPVRSRWNSAAPIPPASAMPDCRSPKPGPGIGEGNSCPGGVTPIAAPERPQYVIPSKPPLPGERTARALGRAAAVDDPRVAAQHVVGLDAQLGACRRQEVGDEDVGRVHQRHQDVATLGGVDVEPERPLAAVADLEEVGDALDARRHPPRRDLPDRVAPRRVLDLEHLGAPVGEDGGRRRDEHEARHLEHTDAVQRTWHSTPPSRHSDPGDQLIMMIMAAGVSGVNQRFREILRRNPDRISHEELTMGASRTYSSLTWRGAHGRRRSRPCEWGQRRPSDRRATTPALEAPMTESIPPLEAFLADAEAWLDEHADPHRHRRRPEAGVGAG